MQLSLSNEAFPSVSLGDLRRGALRRELEGVELIINTAEERSPDGFCPVEAEGSSLEDGQPPVQWLVLGAGASLTELLYWSRQAHLVEAGLVLRETVVETPLCVPLALLHRTDAAEAQRASTWARMHDAATCWEVELGDVGDGQVEEVLDVTMPTLSHVRVRGAGPEVQDGASGTSGMGTLLKELALRGYSGTVALAPSDRGTERAWRQWLFEERGWGCNTAAKKKAAR